MKAGWRWRMVRGGAVPAQQRRGECLGQERQRLEH